MAWTVSIETRHRIVLKWLVKALQNEKLFSFGSGRISACFAKFMGCTTFPRGRGDGANLNCSLLVTLLKSTSWMLFFESVTTKE